VALLILQLLILLRFIIFIGLFYLALHAIAARLITKPESKILEFFNIITSPLLYPVRVWFGADVPPTSLRLRALLFYGVLWLLAAVAAGIVADRT
jgi:uncharacterized protein YggT (Ycf19 family)